MGEKRIIDKGPSDGSSDIITIADGQGMVLMSYASGAGRVKVNPMIVVACTYCDREYYNNPLVGYCSCKIGRLAAHEEGHWSKVYPELKRGRPFCTIHKQIMWRDAHRGVWVCDGCG